MSLTLIVKTIWIKSDFGGRPFEPVVGLRPIIRFQRYVADWFLEAWDVEIVGLDIDPDNWSGLTKIRFARNITPKKEWLKEGELIELLDAYRVIAVGKIETIEKSD
jgi:hypothetical protein